MQNRALAQQKSKRIFYSQTQRGTKGFQGGVVRQSGTGHKAVCWALCVSVTVTKEQEGTVCQESVPGKTQQHH